MGRRSLVQGVFGSGNLFVVDVGEGGGLTARASPHVSAYSMPQVAYSLAQVVW
jgi:hypothetical protein